MILPYDVYNHIIDHADFNTLINLCYIDKQIRILCLKKPFTKILLQFKFNQYYNPDIKSYLLDSFLNDLSGNNQLVLRDIQLTFGSFLTGRNILNKVIVLTGNMKKTFLSLLHKVLGNTMIQSTFGKNNVHQSVSTVHISQWLTNDYLPLLKQLLIANKNIVCGDCDIYDTTIKRILLKIEYNRLYITDALLSVSNVLPAFLTFLLIGCRDCF